MSDILNTPVPIITPHKDQRLIIDFIKNEKGVDSIKISFEPEIPEVRAPSQVAAVNVANHIIRSFGLNNPTKEDTQNGKETKN
jgi:hypothetical protein